MPSTYTQNLGLEMPADGEQAGTWGDTVNSNYVSLDDSINGTLTIPLSASTYSLVTSPGAQSQGQYPHIIWTGALTQQATVNISPPAAQKLYWMYNNTTGGFSVAFQQGTGGTFILQPGYGALIYTDGAGQTAKCAAVNPNPQFNNVLVTGTFTVQGAINWAVAQTVNVPVTFASTATFNGETTAATLSITAGTPATYDIYYRDATGNLAPLHIGSPGQQLIVNASGAVAWGLSQAQVGSIISGSIPSALYFANAGGALAQDARLAATAGTGLGLGLLPAHTFHLGYLLAPEIWLDSNAPGTQQRLLMFATNNTPRWGLYTPGAAESGGNAGSNIVFNAYNDAASSTRTVFGAFRASGNLTVGGSTDLGSQLGVLNQTAGQSAMIVRGAANQTGYLQEWQNSAGTRVASIDANGVLSVAGGGFLSLTANGRLDLGGTVTGHPLGKLHIGPGSESPFGDTLGAIAFESASGYGNCQPNVVKMYYRGTSGTPYFVIQFYYNGTNYYAYLQLVPQVGPVSWGVTTSPL